MSYWSSYPPYVSVAERRKKAEKAAAKAQKGGADLSPIAPYRGAIAKTFWGKAWSENLERYSDYSNRLPRGRTYVRNGSVIDLKVLAGEVLALVMGSSLYTVKVKVEQVQSHLWQAISTDCAGSIDSLVALLQGKLSQPVMQRICQPTVGLFPAPKEIKFSCSCPDSASMCKHVAAVLYGVGARLDAQPELLFGLRQVDAKDLVAQASAVKPSVPQPMEMHKVLVDESLAEMFGLEMAEEPTPKPRKARAKPAAVVKAAQPSAKKVSKSPAGQVATRTAVKKSGKRAAGERLKPKALSASTEKKKPMKRQ